MEIVPCSRVGHVFRSRFPYKFPGGYHEVTVNLARVVHVWMDDYKRFVFLKRPDLRTVDHGDLTSRLELRKRLNCKSFKWYLDNIYPEQQIPADSYLAFGEVRKNLAYSRRLEFLKILTRKSQQVRNATSKNKLAE